MIRRNGWARFSLKAALTLMVIFSGGAYVERRWRVGIDTQESRCLPDSRAFLIDRWNRDIRRGDLVAIRAEGLAPLIADGTTLIKVADGTNGDVVEVGADTVSVNNVVVGRGLALAGRLGRDPADFGRTVTLGDGEIWAMGRTPDSFDSRYWGPVDGGRVIGKAYRLF